MSLELTRRLHPEWRDVNEPTPYPFVDNATLRNAAGKFIPEGTFLDASLYPIGAGPRLRLSRVTVSHAEVVVYLGDEVNELVAYGRFPLLNPPAELSLTDLWGRPAGVLVSTGTRLSIFQAWGIGTHNFTVDATEFVSDVCIPVPPVGLRGFVLADGSVFTGDIWLVGEDGIVLSTSKQSTVDAGGDCDIQEADETIIRVDVVGDPLFRRRLCSGLFTTPRFLRTITAVRGDKQFVCGPDEFGDFKITVGTQDAADTILRVRTTSEGLIFEAVGERLENIG